MKTKSRLRNGLLLLLCALLVSCAAPDLPEESSAPAESSEIAPPVAEDPNAKVARVFLEELLAKEWKTGGEPIEWIPSDRVKTIRDCVKKLKAPILTGEDVRRLAEQASVVVALLRQNPSRFKALPACDVMKGIEWMSAALYEGYYLALLGYTLYLFTPPDYIFREDEVGYWGTYPYDAVMLLYLPLAGNYSSRQEALALLREGRNGVELPLTGLAEGEHPLDFRRCKTPYLLCESGETLTLDLIVWVEALPEDMSLSLAEAYVMDWLARIAGCTDTGEYSFHVFPNGDVLGVYQLLSAEAAQEIREMVELLPAPILTEEAVRDLEHSLAENIFSRIPLLLPGFDGAEGAILPPGIESLEDASQWNGEAGTLIKAAGATAYLIDLFTPSAYRFENSVKAGFSYALCAPGGRYESPADALEAFSDGRARMVWVDAWSPYYIDRDGNLDPVWVIFSVDSSATYDE